MSWERSEIPNAVAAAAVLEALQGRYVNALCAFSGAEPVQRDWLRSGGAQGGGNRQVFAEGGWLAGASVNFSQVHYPADSAARLSVATALSAIVHPRHPLLPSAHLHVSLTQLQNGACSWRLMGDLNPAVESEQHRMQFDRMLARVAPEQVAQAMKNGDRYFTIPALGRQRGVSHFYLERLWRGDAAADLAFAERFGIEMITTYMGFLMEGRGALELPTEAERAAQLAYHTLYLFQVLLLDRGTTAGLLVHDENDVGVLGSLPPRVDKNLLGAWLSRLEQPQDILLERLMRVMPQQGVVEVDESLKKQFAETIRSFYGEFPAALALQAEMPAAGTDEPDEDIDVQEDEIEK